MNLPASQKNERLQTLLATPAMQSKFAEVLKDNAPAFVSSVISAVNANDALQKVEPMSILSSAMVIASLGLQVNPSLGQAHIVPFFDKKKNVTIAQPQVGWKGYYQMAMRTGDYLSINLAEVFEGELSKYNRITGEMEFNGEKKSDAVVGYVLYFKMRSGFEKYFYMTKEECEAHGKKYSKTFRDGYGLWATDFKSMALKTVAKMGLSKYGSLSTQMTKAMEVDQAEVDTQGNAVSFPDAPEPEQAAPKPTASSNLQAIIAAKAAQKPVATADDPGF